MAEVVTSAPAARPGAGSRWRVALTFVAMAAHVFLGLAIVACVFPFVDEVGRRRLIRRWSARILAILGVRLRVVGPTIAAPAAAALVQDALRLRPGRAPVGAMLVMNHVSWLDIFVVNALRPAHFIAKAEIARWPLLGFLVARTGTIFIERGRRHAVREVNHRIATLLREGELVGVFPEGTTGAGDRLLPFHANLLQPAIDAQAAVAVAGIRYREVDGRPTLATLYTGDIDLVASLARLARHGPIVAELHLIDALDTALETASGEAPSRHALGRRTRTLIGDALGFDDARDADDDLSTVIVVPDVSPASSPRDTKPGTSPDPRDELL